MDCFKCDICGKVVEIKNRKRRILTIQSEVYHIPGSVLFDPSEQDIRMDICSNCEKRFLKWIEKKPEEKSEEKQENKLDATTEYIESIIRSCCISSPFPFRGDSKI